MFCGRYAPKRDLRYKLTGSGSVSGTELAPGGISGYLRTYAEPNYSDMPIGLEMTVGYQVGAPGGPYGSASLGGLLTGDHTYSAPMGSVPEAVFLIRGFRVYLMASGLLRLSWDSLDWRVNGVSRWSAGSGSADGSVAACPGSLPFFGTFPEVEASVIVPKFAAATPSGGGAPTGPTVVYSGSCSMQGSWEFDALDGSGWILGGSASPDATTTNTGGGGSATNDAEINRGWAVPTWSTGVVRMEEDALSLPLRHALPRCRKIVVDMTEDYSGGMPPPGDPTPYPAVTGGTTYVDALPALTQFLEIVDDSPGIIETPFPLAGTAPYERLHTVESFDNTNHRTVTQDHERLGPDTAFGQCAPYLDHLLWPIRYHNTWLHPLWSYGDWTPPEVADDAVKWKLAGSSVERGDYWLPERQQHMAHPALPPGANNGRRNFMVSSPIDQNGATGLAQSAIGCVSWWGTQQFEVLDLSDAPGSIALDARSAARWTFKGDGSIGGTGTGSVTSSGVALDAPGTTVDFALGSYTVWPYQALRRFNGLTVPAITNPNVAKIEAFLIGADGAALLIGEIEAGEPQKAFAIARGQGRKHGGSWGHDAGAAWGNDTFTPAYDPAGDASLAVAGDPELSGAYPFLPFGAGQRIRFVLTPVLPADAVSMAFPTFTAPPWEDLLSYADASAFRTVLGGDAPAIRFGTGQHYNPLLGLVNPPGPHDPIDRAVELGDGYAWANLWVYGKAWDDGLDAYLASRYESGVEYTLRAHAWRDPFNQARVTHSFVAQGDDGPVVCLVNSYRAAPPLGYLPHKARSRATGWRATGAYCSMSYLLSPSRRPHVTTTELALERPVGSDVLTGTMPAPDGWQVRYHRLVTDGSEGYQWLPTSEGQPWAKVRPWRGFVWWSGFPNESRGLIAVSSRGDGRLFRLLANEDGKALVETAWAGTPTLWLGSPTTQDIEGGDIRALRGASAVAVAIIADGTLSLSLSRDEGKTLESSVSLGSAEAVTLVDGGDGRLYAAKLSGGAISVSLHSTKDAALLGGPWATNLTGLPEGARIDGDGIRQDGNRLMILLAVATGGAPSLYSSFDGRVFD